MTREAHASSQAIVAEAAAYLADDRHDYPKCRRLLADLLALLTDVGLPHPQQALIRAVETVVTTFQKDEADGYRSKDRQYAIEMLSKFLPRPSADVLLRGEGERQDQKDLEARVDERTDSPLPVTTAGKNEPIPSTASDAQVSNEQLIREGLSRAATCFRLKAEHPEMRPNYDYPMGEWWLIHDLTVALAAASAASRNGGSFKSVEVRPDESDPAFFMSLDDWRRIEDPDGGEIVCLEFAEGGRVNILTDKPLLWIEPERH